MRLIPTLLCGCPFILLGACVPIPAQAIIIEIDYTFDTAGFFTSGSAERDRLEDAASFYENILIDDLTAITPTGTFRDPFFLSTPDALQLNFTNPSTGSAQTVNDRAIAADTIVIYVGARTFSGGTLAEGGFGGISTFGSTAFVNNATSRGETGVGSTDFAPWGGFVSVNDTTTWDTSLAGSGSNQHLYSTLLHEIGHVLGIGTASSWNAQTSGGSFTGAATVAEYGSNVPLNAGGDHWASGTMSEIYLTSTPQEASLDPDILAGTVKLMTELDIAALDDIGWDIALPVPEPSQALLVLLSSFLLFQRRRR